MPKSEVVARLLGGDTLVCTVATNKGQSITLTESSDGLEPVVEGAATLARNKALVDNAWAHAKFTRLKVQLPSEEQQKAAAKRAEAHRDMAEWIAELTDDLTSETEHAWCSDCFALADHVKTDRPFNQVPAYLCSNCGSPTLPCAGPTCDNMASRGRGPLTMPRFCAEHRHEISGFEKIDNKMASLGDYATFLEYDKVKLSRVTKIIGFSLAGVALAVPATLVAAPAIGGAIGVLISGYTGAAATTTGLAFLGGGAIAAGGLGMAGGTVVLTALGGALGGALSASVTNAYVQEDKSFHIEMLQGGTGTPVIVCNGFLSETARGWGEWKSIVTARYPDSPVYRVHWGARELKHLGLMSGTGAAKVIGGAALQQAAAKAARAAATKIGPLGPLLAVADIVKNPWHVAKNRADKTGVVLADLLARTETESFVLVGHSLGARAMVVAAQALGTKPGGPRVEALHLLGVAIGAKGDWSGLADAVDEGVYNYHSTEDGILKYVYAVAQAGKTAAGLTGFRPAPEKINNIDVTNTVTAHSSYHDNVTLR